MDEPQRQIHRPPMPRLQRLSHHRTSPTRHPQSHLRHLPRRPRPRHPQPPRTRPKPNRRLKRSPRTTPNPHTRRPNLARLRNHRRQRRALHHQRTRPEGALGFIGAAPKAGKTWLGIDIAISVATGTPVFGAFPVPQPLPVLYVALEGHKAAIRTRIGCITRGHGKHPEDQHALTNLHLAYKPKGINLASPDWAQALIEDAITLGARFVIIDVLRRAAQIKENDASSFMELVDLLAPISHAGISLGMLHHFDKVNEMTSGRTPAERMAGSGAMFGALDVGLFIAKSEAGHASSRSTPTSATSQRQPSSSSPSKAKARTPRRLHVHRQPAPRHGRRTTTEGL